MRDGWLTGWKAIADYVGVSPRTLCNWSRHGTFPVRNLHGKVVALPLELDTWLVHATDIKRKKETVMNHKSSRSVFRV